MGLVDLRGREDEVRWLLADCGPDWIYELLMERVRTRLLLDARPA